MSKFLLCGLMALALVGCPTGSHPLERPKAVLLTSVNGQVVNSAQVPLLVSLSYSASSASVKVTIDILDGQTVVQSITPEKLLLPLPVPGFELGKESVALVEATISLPEGTSGNKSYMARVTWKEPYTTDDIRTLTSPPINLQIVLPSK